MRNASDRRTGIALKTLGLDLNSPHVSDEEVSRAYRKLALNYHPDRHVNDTDEQKKKAAELFKEVADAKDFLIDPAGLGKGYNPPQQSSAQPTSQPPSPQSTSAPQPTTSPSPQPTPQPSYDDDDSIPRASSSDTRASSSSSRVPRDDNDQSEEVKKNLADYLAYFAAVKSAADKMGPNDEKLDFGPTKLPPGINGDNAFASVLHCRVEKLSDEASIKAIKNTMDKMTPEQMKDMKEGKTLLSIGKSATGEYSANIVPVPRPQPAAANGQKTDAFGHTESRTAAAPSAHNP